MKPARERIKAKRDEILKGLEANLRLVAILTEDFDINATTEEEAAELERCEVDMHNAIRQIFDDYVGW